VNFTVEPSVIGMTTFTTPTQVPPLVRIQRTRPEPARCGLVEVDALSGAAVAA
jgi:hypothetical protein